MFALEITISSVILAKEVNTKTHEDLSRNNIEDTSQGIESLRVCRLSVLPGDSKGWESGV